MAGGGWSAASADVAEISAKLTTLPARFGTVFLADKSLEQHVKTRASALREAFERVAEADEWGIKVFADCPSYCYMFVAQ